MEQLFCDGVVAITILDGTVRLDLGRFGIAPSGSGKSAPEVVLRVIMGNDAFIRSFEQLETARKYVAGGGPQERAAFAADSKPHGAAEAAAPGAAAQAPEPIPFQSRPIKQVFP